MTINIQNVLLIVITTFLLTVILTPVIKRMAIHIGAVDYPDDRKVHSKVMPRLGGIAIFISFIIGYILFGTESTEMISILIGGFFIILTGVIDDIKPLPARIKFYGQLIGALIIPFYGNILLDNISAFNTTINFGIWAYPIMVIFILGIINCINLIDGLDGLASGISSIYFLTIGIIAYIMNSIGGLDVVLAFIMLGATLGILVFNFYPAKIFIGDSGSMFLGYIIAVIALLGFKNVTLTSLIVPLLILAIPILDTLFAIIRRTIKHQPISQPDREHLHHQFLNMKFGHRNTVLVIYLINILFAFASIIYVIKDAKTGIVIYSILFILTIWFIFTTNIITENTKNIIKIMKDAKKKHK